MDSLSPQQPRRVRIVQNDSTRATVLDAVSGDVIRGVQSVLVELDAASRGTAVLTLAAPDVELEVLAEARVDPLKLAALLWRRALEQRGVASTSLDFDRLPEGEAEFWVLLAETAFAFIDAFNRR
jgi:hypothetical protein